MLYDITPPITSSLAVWPGDTQLSRDVLLDMHKGDNVTLSTLRATVHLGAHADGPNHYGVDAPAIDQRSLDYYLGPAQVVHVDVPRGERVTCEMFFAAQPQPSRAVPSPVSRILIATATYPDPNNLNKDFAALSPDLIDALHERAVKTIGIDTPSVDLFDSKDLPSHKRFLANDMAILVVVLLNDVPAGVYELIALPLKLVGFDASPVRAILRQI